MKIKDAGIDGELCQSEVCNKEEREKSEAYSFEPEKK